MDTFFRLRDAVDHEKGQARKVEKLLRRHATITAITESGLERSGAGAVAGMEVVHDGRTALHVGSMTGTSRSRRFDLVNYMRKLRQQIFSLFEHHPQEVVQHVSFEGADAWRPTFSLTHNAVPAEFVT